MAINSFDVNKYLIDGCMRCKLGATPNCKVHNWQTVLQTLRKILLETNLTEEIKWGVPCYTHNNKNILMLSAFKNYVCVSFFKGALLKDHKKILLKQGENAQLVRVLKYTHTTQIIEQAKIIKMYILEMLEIEKSEQKIVLPQKTEIIPDELNSIFNNDSTLKNAFFKLTVGKQRGYIIYFNQTKNSSTRFSRIEKCKQKILNGEGLHDKYSK